RIFLYVGEILVAFVLRLTKVMNAPVEIPRLRERLRQHVVKPSGIVYRAVLQDRTAARSIMLKKLRVQHERLTERGNGFLVFLVAKIGVTEVAVEHSHIAAHLNGLVIRLNGLLEFLALIPNRPDIIFGVGIPRID